MEGGREIGQIVDEVPNQATSKLNVKSKYRHQFYQEADKVVVTCNYVGKRTNIDLIDVLYSLALSLTSLVRMLVTFKPAYLERLHQKVANTKSCQAKLKSTLLKLKRAEPLNWTSLYSAVAHKVAVVSGTGCRRPSNPSPKRHRIDSGEVEAEKLGENREKLGADAFQENREKLCADAVLPAVMRRRVSEEGAGLLEKSQHD
ncbi:protein SGT1 homolog [Eucalyptus grandis]|uniref:protein SGT1 homolog n=1 Tax=Eucalyptus grandis TaxID=71139 RepID=UPI00192EF7E5|nr:protein SGT1 homolog [Eucalyptus grandis]